MTRVLIVDDEVDIAETLQSFLELEGFEAVVAVDGVEALQKAHDTDPDLILTDMMMPRMGGPELIARIRESPELEHTPIIAMSGKHQVTDDVPFFHKPFEPDALIAEIRHLVADPDR